MTDNAELTFILDAIRATYSRDSYVPLSQQAIEQLDWKEIRRLANFHRIKPVLVDVLATYQRAGIPGSQPLFDYNSYQIFKSFTDTIELVRLLTLFRDNAIPVLPYKGYLFIHEFYGKSINREVDDIDLLFQRDSVHEAISLLQADGYVLRVKDGPILPEEANRRIDSILNAAGKYELSLQKDKHVIDVHWRLNYSFLPYRLDHEQFFRLANEKTFYTITCNVPDPETMFWMLILHHGGKELWLRLKHLVDLLAFMSAYKEQLDWAEILSKAKEYKLFTAMMTGFYLAQVHFSIVLPPAICEALASFQPPNATRIERYWHYANHWLNVKPMLLFERMCITNQDEGFSKWQYIRGLIYEHSLPNPVGRRAMITIPERFWYLSFVYKLASYVRRRLY